MTGDGAIWVGLLDMAASGSVANVGGPVRPAHRQARVLVTVHGAPVGYVVVPSQPVGTLTVRVRQEAERALAVPLQKHAAQHTDIAGQIATESWSARVACPLDFPAPDGAGVSVVICTRDRTDMLKDCLAAVRLARYEPLEILVVDNAPKGDGARQLVTAIAHDDPRVRYTCEPRPGLSRARNHGLAHARFDVVAFTDDDTLADPGWPSAVAAGFAADPETVCVTGLVASGALDTASQRYFDARYAWGESFEPRRYDLAANRDPSRLYPYSAGVFGTGANLAVRASVIRRLGGFDPLLGVGSPGRGGEDLDIFLRLLLAGWRICYLPSALVWHQHRADAQALGEQMYSYGYGLGAYLAKHLLNGQLPVSMLGRGFLQSSVVMGRMRHASQASQLGGSAKRIAITEAWGVVSGMLGYCLTASLSCHHAAKVR